MAGGTPANPATPAPLSRRPADRHWSAELEPSHAHSFVELGQGGGEDRRIRGCVWGRPVVAVVVRLPQPVVHWHHKPRLEPPRQQGGLVGIHIAASSVDADECRVQPFTRYAAKVLVVLGVSRMPQPDAVD